MARVDDAPGGHVTERLLRRVRRLRRLAADLEACATDTAVDLEIVRRAMAADASGRLVGSVDRALMRAAVGRYREALEAAAAGLRTMEVRPQRAGSAMVRLDGAAWVRLSCGDARLLQVLAAAMPPEPDGCSGWRTYEEVAAALTAQRGTAPTRRALVESVYRIRRALKLADINPFTLRVDRRGGRLRLLLRVEAATATSRPATQPDQMRGTS